VLLPAHQSPTGRRHQADVQEAVWLQVQSYFVSVANKAATGPLANNEAVSYRDMVAKVAA